MFLAAIAHILAFPAKPYMIEEPDESPSLWSNIAHAANVSDFHSDVRDHWSSLSSSISMPNFKQVFNRRKKVKVSKEEPSEDDALLDDAGQKGNKQHVV